MKENTTTINDTVGVPLDGGTPREERSVGTLRDLSYKERLLASIDMLSRLSEAQGANVDLLSQIDAVKGFVLCWRTWTPRVSPSCCGR